MSYLKFLYALVPPNLAITTFNILTKNENRTTSVVREKNIRKKLDSKATVARSTPVSSPEMNSSCVRKYLDDRKKLRP